MNLPYNRPRKSLDLKTPLEVFIEQSVTLNSRFQDVMKTFIKNLLRRTGREFRIVDAPTRSFSRGMEILREVITPETVIDIGVASGTPELYKHFNSQSYLLIEANPAFKPDLLFIKSQLNAVIENVFCGSERGQTLLKIYSDPRKSSVFEITREMKQVEEIQVPVERLDSLVQKYNLEPPYLIKIDVEGAEIEVIKGAESTLVQTQAVVAEASVLPKYKGGPELADLVVLMYEKGFSVFDILAGTNHPNGNYLFQVDLVFVKTDAKFRNLIRKIN